MKLLLVCNPGGHFYHDGTENFGLPTQESGLLTPKSTLNHCLEKKWSIVEMQEHECYGRMCELPQSFVYLRKSRLIWYSAQEQA